MLSREVDECKPLMGGAQFGAPGAKAALARFDALAAGDPEDVASFDTPRAKAIELVEKALKAAGKAPGDADYAAFKDVQVDKVLAVLMKWQANAHLYRNVANGVTAGGAEGAGTAAGAYNRPLFGST